MLTAISYPEPVLRNAGSGYEIVLTAVHFKRQLTTSNDAGPELLPINDNVSVFVQSVLALNFNKLYDLNISQQMILILLQTTP